MKWMPIEKGQPTERDWYYVTIVFDGTYRWVKSIAWDGIWVIPGDEHDRKLSRVVAWLPHPEPYKEARPK